MTVSMPQLERALATAIDDFTCCGLYTEKLHHVPVRLALFGVVHGWCYRTGSIWVPYASWERAANVIFRRPRIALTDVLRHEMAHALAFQHNRLVDTPAFKEVFGGRHDDRWDDEEEYDASLFVTDYAPTSPAEDFAETVMVFTRCRGKVTRYRHRPGVMRGFAFVRRLSQRLKSSGLLR